MKGCMIVLAFGGMAMSLVSAQSQLSLLYPFGIPIQQNSASSFFIGGAATAVVDDYTVMLRNPANLGFIDKTVFSSLFAFQVTQVAESDRHNNFKTGYPRQVSLGIPAGKFGTIGISYDNRSDAATKFRPASQQFGFDGSTVTYQGGIATTGALVGWQVGWGREIPSLLHMRVGATYERIYFSYTETILRSVTDISRTIESRDSTYKIFGANAFRGGIMLPLDKIKVGLSGEYYFPAEVRWNNAIYSASSDTSNSYGTVAVPIDRIDRNAKVRVPPSIALGISYSMSPEWLAAADFSSVLWNLYNGRGLFSSARSSMAPSFSAGVQYVPTVALLNPKYWETVRYGAGFRFAELPAKQSSEFAFSLGTGLPIGKGRGEFDIGAEFGRRTSGNYSGYKENFIQIAIGVNGGHKWSKSSEGNY
jgi:hypothetical protein